MPGSPGRRSPSRPQSCCKRRLSLDRAEADPDRRARAHVGRERITCGPWSMTSGSSNTRTGVIPSWETGYCVDDVARLAVVALELTGRAADRQWTPILHRSLAFLHSRRAPRARGCGTSWATTDAGSTSRMSATTSAERSGRSVRSSRPPGCRPSSGPARALLDALVPARSRKTSRSEQPPTRCSASRASTPTGSTTTRRVLLERARRTARGRVRTTQQEELAVVRGRAHLRQRAPPAGADRRRRRARRDD